MKHFKVITLCFALIITKAQIEAGETNIGVARPVCVTERELHGCKDTKLDTKDSYFYLYTANNKENPEALHKCGRSLPSDTYFNKDYPLIFIIHGILQNPCTGAWQKEMKNEFLRRQNYNIILVDYAQSNFPDIYDAVYQGREVAKELVILISNIVRQTNIDPKKIHLIGHSLGSHVAGLVGKNVSIGRITGLDPGGVVFHKFSENEKLGRNDADLVDIIHTSAGLCLPDAIGYLYPLGDEDFYVADGTHQPKCYITALQQILKGDWILGFGSLVYPTLCNHIIATNYFITSINHGDCYYIGKQCNNYKEAMTTTCDKKDNNYSIMGFDWPLRYKTKQKDQRVYNVQVGSSCPYCIKDMNGMESLNLKT